MSRIIRAASTLPGFEEPEHVWEPPRRVPTGRVFRSNPEPTAAEIAAREQARAREEEYNRKRINGLLERLPVQIRNGDVLRLTGAAKPPEAAAVPDTAVKPTMVARYRALAPRPSGGLKLTGAQAGAYWFRDLVGTRGRANRYRERD